MKTNRLEAFSDGVFAIAITLLVLEIDVPPSNRLGAGLASLWPSYLAYAVSFIVIGAIWINHHTMFQHIVRTDEQFLLLNVVHLMFVAFLPFPTAVLAEAFHDRSGEAVAAAFYGGTLTIIGILVTALASLLLQCGTTQHMDIDSSTRRSLPSKLRESAEDSLLAQSAM